jgi:SAM-dependent methyltransferase
MPAVSLPQPWLEDSLDQLDLRPKDRCLLLGCPTPAHLAAVSQLVGRRASIVVVEPDADLAGQATKADHKRLEVLACAPRGDERFGTFDALLACPLTTMGWPLELWCQLISHNLRPGGRFVIDLPAESPNEPLRRAWADIGGDAAVLQALCGPAEAAVAHRLREVGMRSVEASVGTHVLHLESPSALARLVGELGLADAEQLADLERRLVEELRTNGEIDAVFHRTRVRGQR